MVTREDRAGSEFKENHPSFFSCPRSSSRSKHRVFFSRCAGSNYFSGPHSHGRLTPSSRRGSSSRSLEKKENVRVTRDSRNQPLRRGRSVVPRVIRTGEKKLAKLNVRSCLERIEGRHDKPLVLPSRPLLSGTDYLRLIIRATTRDRSK